MPLGKSKGYNDLVRLTLILMIFLLVLSEPLQCWAKYTQQSVPYIFVLENLTHLGFHDCSSLHDVSNLDTSTASFCACMWTHNRWEP